MKRSPQRSFLSRTAVPVLTLAIALTLSGVMLSSGKALAGIPAEEWVARFDGGASAIDAPRALIVDAKGNVYVTGVAQYEAGGGQVYTDFATVAYDPDGSELWRAHYNGPLDYTDEAQAIALDSGGNVLVTGFSYGLGTSSDYTTIKYDPHGNPLWVARYNGPGNDTDEPASVAVDAQDNVYVTGFSDAGGSQYDYATIKYDSDGNESWVVRYDGPYGWRDQAYGMALDAAGNPVVTGSSYGSSTGIDYATVKYDPNGTVLWVARYGPEEGFSEGKAVVSDDEGNVYVTGNSWSDFATIKYDPDGNEIWAARYGGPGFNDDVADLTVDASGNVYVTGTSDGGDERKGDYATIKYDSQGDELWVARFNGPINETDRAAGLAVDTAGNVYVTGSMTVVVWMCGLGKWCNGTDYATLKYDADGNPLWTAVYRGPGGSAQWTYDTAADLTIDAAGNLFVTGSSYGVTSGSDFATVKYLEMSAWGAAATVEIAGTDRAAGSRRNLVGLLLLTLPIPPLAVLVFRKRSRLRKPSLDP